MADDGRSGGVGGSAGARHEDATADGHDVEGVDWRGWLLVAVVVLSFVVVPVVVTLRPPRLPFEAAFLALPMVPAVLLGATAVWVAVSGR